MKFLPCARLVCFVQNIKFVETLKIRVMLGKAGVIVISVLIQMHCILLYYDWQTQGMWHVMLACATILMKHVLLCQLLFNTCYSLAPGSGVKD